MNSSNSPRQPMLRRTWVRIVLLLLAAVASALWFASPEPPPPPLASGMPMKAIVYHEYGPPDVLQLREVDKPLPRENQVLVRIRAAAANPLDWHYMRGTPYLMRIDSGFRKPKDPSVGVDMAGVVEAVGTNVTQYTPGDEVFGTVNGAFAEYALTTERRIAPKPANLTFEQAAAVPVAALTALQGLRDKGKIRPGQKVLINGASGGVGTFAVQIAKSLGAEVTGVCSTRNLELARSLGADHVIDYTREDFTQGPQEYDVILDNVGNRSLSDYRRVLGPRGIYVLIGGGGPNDGRWIGPFGKVIQALLLSAFVDQELGMMLSSTNKDDLLLLKGLIETDKLRPVIDRTYPLGEAAAAIRYLETGRARGKVIIAVSNGASP
jgi:NADPH:quinone reductase-like Zn-dependent oxidoreductase